jgi:hypothetical protein
VINTTTQSVLLASAFALMTAGAQAATLSSVAIVETLPFGASTNANASAGGDASVFGAPGTVAIQNADGTSEVSAAVNGFGGEQKVTATAAFEQSETNTSGAARDYTLSYELTGQSAEFNVGFGDVAVAQLRAQPQARTLSFPQTAALPEVTTARTSGVAPTNSDNPFTEIDDPRVRPGSIIPVAAASFEYIIQVDGETLLTARADALLDTFNVSDGLVFDAVSGFTPQSVANAIGGFTFTVGEISGSFDLGTREDGETINITSTLIARSYTSGFVGDGQEPVSVNTFSLDPVSLFSIGISLSSDPTIPTNPSAVPLPAAGWMLLAGLGGLVAAGRRKKA